MVFNSLQFLLFYIIVTISYYLLANRYRWILLLLASCYFYMAFVPIYILVLAGTIIIDYFAGIYIEKTSDQKRKKRFLILSLITNIGILLVFKYYNFFAANVNQVATSFDWQARLFYLKILLPIGLSFHTFQAMSYTIEVYRGNQKAEKHLGIYALYVMFYPQLVAGPIERPQNILPQFRASHPYHAENIKAGLIQMAFGLFKKVVIADRIAFLVDRAYANPHQSSGKTLLLATLLYSIQIYCDFSGYADMGIGAAKTMGITLMTNFRSPYFSRSVNEFWTRWHISLSTWFRDYLYIPLGGNRVPVPRWFLNLFIVFIVSGFWHGASWTFIVWGCLHALFMVVEISKNFLLKKTGYSFKPNAFKTIIQIAVTFALVSFAWIFFRSPDIHSAFYIAGKIITINATGSSSFTHLQLTIAAVLILILLLKDNFFETINTRNNYLFAALLIGLLCCCYLFGVFDNKQFIYFQF